jgi:hypothetical protein
LAIKHRGRVSANELSVAIDAVQEIPRPRPPPELTDEQAQEWRAIVDRMPAEWFPRETHALLTQYCRAVVRARHLAQLIDELQTSEDFNIREYSALLRDEQLQSRLIATLSMKMRISQESTYDQTKRKPVSVKKPWDK